MLKNTYFLGKNCKNRLSVGGSAPEPPFASGGWGLRPRTPAFFFPAYYCNFVEFVSSAKCILFRSKKEPSNTLDTPLIINK